MQASREQRMWWAKPRDSYEEGEPLDPKAQHFRNATVRCVCILRSCRFLFGLAWFAVVVTSFLPVVLCTMHGVLIGARAGDWQCVRDARANGGQSPQGHARTQGRGYSVGHAVMSRRRQAATGFCRKHRSAKKKQAGKQTLLVVWNKRELALTEAFAVIYCMVRDYRVSR